MKQRVQDHPAFHFANAARTKALQNARSTVILLCGLLIVVVLVDLGVHLASSPEVPEIPGAPGFVKGVLARLRTDPANVIELDCDGRIISLSETDLRWYVGREQGSAIAAQFRERDRRIRDLESAVIQKSLLEFQVKFGAGVGLSSGAKEELKRVNDFVEAKNFGRASDGFTSIIGGWSNETRKHVGEKAIFELNFGLQELASLSRQQFESRGVNLQPPRMHQIFWSSPMGSLVESLFWSLFGLLTNLILNISQARANGTFKPDERWVIWAKLCYGPVLSIVLLLTIYFGILNVGSETRFWLLPLLGFLFGYNSRKVALAIDKLSDKVFGNISKSTDEGLAWHSEAADHAAEKLCLQTKPASVEEIKQQAPRLIDAAIIAAMLKNRTES